MIFFVNVQKLQNQLDLVGNMLKSPYCAVWSTTDSNQSIDWPITHHK